MWGQGFPAPIFEDDFVVESQRILKEKHLKMRLRKGELRLDAIQFNFSESPGGTRSEMASRTTNPGSVPSESYRLVT